MSVFQQLSYENLLLLGEMTINPMIHNFLDLLPKDQATDFGTFEVATNVLMKYDSIPQVAAIKRELAGQPVATWATFDKRI